MPGNINKPPNPWSHHNLTSSSPGGVQRGIVVDIDDSQEGGQYAQTGRVKIRMPHWDRQEIPDADLPWVPTLDQSEATNGLGQRGKHLPGKVVMCMKGDDQNWNIVGGAQNNNQGDSQGINKPGAANPKDLHHSNEQYENRTFGWPKNIEQVYLSKTTEEAEQQGMLMGSGSGRVAELNYEPVKESRDGHVCPPYCNKRPYCKDGA